MQHQVCKMLAQGLVLLACLASKHRQAQDKIGDDTRPSLVCEGEHVGGVIVCAKIAVQAPPSARIDKNQGELRIGFQRHGYPAAQRGAGRQIRMADGPDKGKVQARLAFAHCLPETCVHFARISRGGRADGELGADTVALAARS